MWVVFGASVMLFLISSGLFVYTWTYSGYLRRWERELEAEQHALTYLRTIAELKGIEIPEVVIDTEAI